jgi:GNAT superfamily N-acetyltransferase
VPVEDLDTLRQWIHIASVGFQVPTELEDTWHEFFAEAACTRPFRTYLGLWNGEPVATSQLFTSAGVAGIYNVTCLPELRGRGIGTSVVMAPLMTARAMGYRVAILQASSMGYPVYRRIGFQDFGKLSLYLWEQNSSD